MNNKTILKLASGEMHQARKDVSDFMRGDDKGMDWRWQLLGAPVVENLAVRMPAQAYVNRAIGSTDHPKGAEGHMADKYLREYAMKKKIGITDSPNVPLKAGGKFVERMMAKKLKQMADSPHFNLGTGLVNLPEKLNSPGILAHELGHASQGKANMVMNPLGKLVNSMGTANVALQHNKDDSFNSALTGTAGGLATLTNELHASAIGSKLLGESGVKGLRRMSSFKGTPTYAMLSALPMATYGAKKYFGGFDGQ